MKVIAREYESNRIVRADNDEDWARVWRPSGERRPVLLSCGEGSCHVRLCAVQKQRKSDGQITRWFAFTKGASCDHNEVDTPIILPTPAMTPAHAVRPGGETPEHLWLKDFVERAALDSGYQAVVQEQESPQRGIIPDVTILDAAAGRRVEVQRGATDVPRRTEKDPDVVWLLRLGEDFRNDKYLFDWPCVSVRVTARDKSAYPPEGNKRIIAKPWIERFPLSNVQVDAMGTVLRRRSAPDPTSVHGFFETHPIPLDQFLNHVWAGKRRWYPRNEIHKFGGWALESQVEEYHTWLEQHFADAHDDGAGIVHEVPRQRESDAERVAEPQIGAAEQTKPAKAITYHANPPIDEMEAQSAPENLQSKNRNNEGGNAVRVETYPDAIQPSGSPSKDNNLWRRIRRWFGA